MDTLLKNQYGSNQEEFLNEDGEFEYGSNYTLPSPIKKLTEYVCVRCGKEYKSYEWWKKHDAKNNCVGKYNCHCGKKYKSYKWYTKHLALKH